MYELTLTIERPSGRPGSVYIKLPFLPVRGMTIDLIEASSRRWRHFLVVGDPHVDIDESGKGGYEAPDISLRVAVREDTDREEIR